jgi:UDP-glucose 6-dehydrogenase
MTVINRRGVKKQGKKYRICVVGAGHVGLVAAACFADLGHKVICVDKDKKRITSLNKKALPFYAFIHEGSRLSLCDPQSLGEAKKIFKNSRKIKFTRNPYEAVKGCDCLCLLTEWKEFRGLDLKRVKKLMRYPFIADGRNMFDRDKVRRMGLGYIGMGK